MYELNIFVDHYKAIMDEEGRFYNFDLKPANVAWEPFVVLVPLKGGQDRADRRGQHVVSSTLV